MTRNGVGQETELIATLPPRLDLVELAMRAGRKMVDKIVDALKLSQLATAGSGTRPLEGAMRVWNQEAAAIAP